MGKRAARRAWHPEDIKAEIRKRVTAGGKKATLTRLALDNGLPECACRVALLKPYHAAEQVIARFLRLPPERLWPDRYNAKGQPLHPHLRRQNKPRRCEGHRQINGRA